MVFSLSDFSSTLHPIISRCVLPETEVHSDDLDSYRQTDQRINNISAHQMKPKPSKDTSGIRKKRKLSFTLSKTDKTCLDDGNGCDKETSVTSAENCSVKDCKSVSETDDFICETQLDNENNSSFFRSEAKPKFAPNTGLLEGITCIPASPIDSDSNGDSVSNAESSTASTELKLSSSLLTLGRSTRY